MSSFSCNCQRTCQGTTLRRRLSHWHPRHVRVRTRSSAAEEQQQVKQATLIIGDVEGGQVCDYPGCLVVVGDVDKGATLRADGDILVWGRLEGRVHAGRSSPGGCRVMALELRGAQLKVGEVDSLAAAKVTVAGPHTARVTEVGRRRALQLEPAAGPAISPDAAVLAASKVRWLRWYPAAGAALFTGLYACLAGGLLLAAPQACFALLFPGTAVPVGWIRVGALLLVTFGAQYLGAAVRDWAAAAASRPRPAPAPVVKKQPAADSSSSSSTGSAEWGAAPIPPDAIMEAYTSGSYDEGDALLWAATLPPGAQQKQPAAAGGAGAGPGSVVVKTTSAKTLSRGLDTTARRQAAQAAGGGSRVTGLMQKLEDMATSSSSSSSSSSRSSSSSSSSSSNPTSERNADEANNTSASTTSSSSSGGSGGSSAATPSPGLLPLGLVRPAATWLYSSNGFYWASIWSRLLLAGGFTVLVVTGQVGPGLLLLAGMNALGALSMAGALRRQHAHHVLGDAPRQSLLGFLLEGAL